MTIRSLPLAQDVVDHAVHGSYCPKLCSHTCPVLEATGRTDAVPWGFHRTVADLATERLTPSEAAGRLVACTGCGACAGGCKIEGQDVPAQVRAGRAAVVAAGAGLPAVAAAATEVAAGRSPYGVQPGSSISSTAATITLLAGCRDEARTVQDATRLLAAAGETIAIVVPAGCCGAVLRDLGDTEAADAARAAVRSELPRTGRIALLDPHCRPETEAAAPDTEVVDLVALLAELVAAGSLTITHGPQVVRWHEPCLLVDGAAAGRGPTVLASTGSLVELPGEAHRGCSGGGMGMDLLDAGAANEVAVRRLEHVAGPGPLVTGCAGAARRFAAAGTDAHHLVTHLAGLLDDESDTVA
jgi:Fe-S oxidoreductase